MDDVEYNDDDFPTKSTQPSNCIRFSGSLIFQQQPGCQWLSSRHSLVDIVQLLQSHCRHQVDKLHFSAEHVVVGNQ